MADESNEVHQTSAFMFKYLAFRVKGSYMVQGSLIFNMHEDEISKQIREGLASAEEGEIAYVCKVEERITAKIEYTFVIETPK